MLLQELGQFQGPHACSPRNGCAERAQPLPAGVCALHIKDLVKGKREAQSQTLKHRLVRTLPLPQFARRIRAGNVSEDEEVARVGMRAALAATQFRHFDANNDGRLTTEDLVRVFAMVDGVTLEKAHAIARRVLDHAEKKGDEGLTYKDFVTQLEEDFSERHTFDHFLKQLRPVTTASSLKRTSISGGLDAEVERCHLLLCPPRALPARLGRLGLHAALQRGVERSSVRLDC